MNFDLSDEQKMLADTVRRVFSERSSSERLRELIDDGLGFDEALWRELAEMGILGAAIDEAHGGLGLGTLELCVIAQELGRSNASVPFMSSICFAAEALRLFGNDAQQARWLPGIASGGAVATMAFAEGASDMWDILPATTFSDGRLSGVKWPVADLAISEVAIVACAFEGQPRLALLELSGDGVERKPLGSFDELRSHGRLALDSAPAELLPVRDSAAIQALLDRFAVLTAFEQIGGAEACLHMARDYALERRVFARPLASYQAIKHKLADLFVLIELARASAYYAAWMVVTESERLAETAAAARLTAIEAFEHSARDNLQVHGGFGYTFEADCHFYYRRERLLATMFGGTARWSGRLIRAIPDISRSAAA